MKADEFQRIGQTLFGQRWQYAMATVLQAHPRTVRYWATGDYRITEETEERVRRIVRDRIRNLDNEIIHRKKKYNEKLQEYRKSILSLSE